MRLSKKITYAALAGAVYAAVTLAVAPVAFGPIQFRISEALTVLPFIFPASSWGLFAGCLFANLIGSGNILDIIFGSLATLLAAFLTSKCKNRWLAPLPPVLVNAVVIGLVLGFSASASDPWMTSLVIGLQILVSQAVICYGIGLPLLHILNRFFKKPEAGNTDHIGGYHP